MNIDKMIEQWEEKHSSLLDEYSKGNANNEVMQMYRNQMKNVLDFINQLKQVKNCIKPHVIKSVCDHPWQELESVMGDGVLCRKCNTVIKQTDI